MVAMAMALATALAAAGYGEEPDMGARLSREFVRELEFGAIMPSGAADIRRYDRFYAVEWIDGRPVVRGTFLERDDAQSEGRIYRVLAAQRPLVAGGGCSVVSLSYDPDEGGSPSLNCNGEAGTAERARRRQGVQRGPPQTVEFPRP